MLPREEQFSGSLVGQCLGDALGFVVEGYPREVCQSYVEGFLRKGRAGEKGRPPFPFGQYSDDSQLARELLQSYVSQGYFDPADYARRIAAIFSEGRIVGPGGATTQAARRLIQGVPWEEAGTPPPAAGNGSAMRAGPIGLIFFDHPPKLTEAAHLQGWITHRDPRCSAGAIAIAGAVALALDPEPIQTFSFLEKLKGWTQNRDPSLASGLEKLKEWLFLPPEKVAGPISRFGQDATPMEGWEGISPFVTGSVLWSLYAFLRSPEDYWETLCTAIRAGGDVDTTAAMAGAISGAHLGLKALPLPLAQRLTDRGSWGFEELLELAKKAYRLKMEE